MEDEEDLNDGDEEDAKDDDDDDTDDDDDDADAAAEAEADDEGGIPFSWSFRDKGSSPPLCFAKSNSR